MPIEINELHIKINVEKQSAQASNMVTNSFSQEAQQQLLAECIEEVMQLLDDKKER